METNEKHSPAPSLLIIGGTTEGRVASEVSDAAGKTFYYSTKSSEQEVTSAHGVRLSGGMDEEAMTTLLREKDIHLIIDASHPFASLVHQTVGKASSTVGVPVLRFERHYPPRDERLRYFDGYPSLLDHLASFPPAKLLSLAGVSSIARLSSLPSDTELFVRIMRRSDSLATVEKYHFPPDHLIFYDEGEKDEELLGRIRPDAILTKESGESGGFPSKVQHALDLGIRVLVLKKPKLPYTPDAVVYGRHGLRRAIEKLLPGFYDLKTGFTTGSCATACTVAALHTLLGRKPPLTEAPFTLPDGEPMSMPIFSVAPNSDGSVTATVLKDSGDDADVTNGTRITSTVRRSERHDEVHFIAGKGVGTVTLPGLGLEIGGPAINRTPRSMMESEIRKMCPIGGFDVTISVPDGEDLAKKTFNPKLGVVDGISIVGTSGIIYPFSLSGWVNSIRKEIQVARALGVRTLVLNSGAKSERFVKALFPNLPPQAFVQYGNFIGETIKMGAEEGFREIALAMMIGKAVKLAEGELDTHSKKTTMHHDFLLRIARESGCSEETQEKIKGITMARELWAIVPDEEKAFFGHITELCHKVTSPLIPQGRLRLYLLDDTGTLRTSIIPPEK